MPPYQIILEDRGVYIRHTGTLSDGDVLKLAHEFGNNYRSEKVRYVLTDFLDCKGVSFSPSLANELSTLSHEFPIADDSLKFALVVTDFPDLLATASAYLQHSLPPYEVRLFSELNQAREWCEN